MASYLSELDFTKAFDLVN